MNDEVKHYFDKQKSPQREICECLRKIIFDVFPNISEEMKWGVPSYAGGIYYIVALKDHVNMGFSIKNLTEDELKLFDGGGKSTKHIAITSLNCVEKERIVSLLNLIEKRQE